MIKNLIIFNFIIITFAAAFLNNTVILFDKNGAELGYGIIVAPETIILPSIKVYENLEKFAFLVEYDNDPDKTIKYMISSQNLTELDDVTFILKTNIKFLVKNDEIKLNNDERSTKISRYPFCYKTNILTTFGKTAKQSWSMRYPISHEEKMVEKHFFEWECNNEKNQICGNLNIENKAGTAVINEIDNSTYLIGLKEDENSGTFNLLTQKCDNLPMFKFCDIMLPSIKTLTFCNAQRISQNLKTSGHSEIVLIGTAEIQAPSSFVPSGFAVILYERHVIVFSDFKNVQKEIENFEIYGSGSKTEVAIMENNVVHFPGSYEDIEIGKMDIKLLKFEKAFFENLQKAKLSFNYANITTLENLQTFQFIKNDDNESFILQNQNEAQNSMYPLLGTPILFDNGQIVGFQQNGSEFISVFEMKDVLEQNIPELVRNVPELVRNIPELVRNVPEVVRNVPELINETIVTVPKVDITTNEISTTPKNQNTNANYLFTTTSPESSESTKLKICFWILPLLIFL